MAISQSVWQSIHLLRIEFKWMIEYSSNSFQTRHHYHYTIDQVYGNANHFDEKTIVELIKTQRSRDCMNLIRESRSETVQLFGPFLKVLSAKGWATPARFMFGRVSMRTEWPIMK